MTTDSSKTSVDSSVKSSIYEEPTEETPLLERKDSRVSILWKKSVVFRVILTGFFVSATFGVTQVPIVFAFYQMTCDEFYKTHPLPPPGLDRCRNNQIDADTARSYALLGASTTLFGVFNLLFTGWTIKAFGVKKALLLSVFFPAVRLLVQNVGVETGAGWGIVIVQCSQIITVVGGPAGYVLALNSFATEVVEPAERTGTLGRLTGSTMFGTALGFLAGGLIGDAFGIIWPFRVTLALFLLCCLYVLSCLPTIHNKDIETKSTKSLASFFAPLKMFTPQKWCSPTGIVKREYGVLLLGIGTFLGVLATSYIPVMLQLYSTDVFGFGSTENGWLIALNCLVRGMFLTFVFPHLIKAGRKWHDKRNAEKQHAQTSTIEERCNPDIPTDANSVASVPGVMEPAREPNEPPASSRDENESFAFDLVFTKYSLIVDGFLTGLATFTSAGWQMYLIAVILPLASGTGPAAKGTILQMCPPRQRADALGAISLVDLVAKLSSTSLFGVIFAAFADIGKSNLTFAVNAAVAVVGFAVLILVKFPSEGSQRIEEHEHEYQAG